MSTDLQEILDRIGNLTPEEFKILAETFKEGYQPITEHKNGSDNVKPKRIYIPGSITQTDEEIEAELATILTPEERAELDSFKPLEIKLPPGAKTTSELISEDREERF